MWRVRSPPAPCARCARARVARPAMERVPCDGSGRGASLAMPAMRGAAGKDRATTVQGTVQQAIRRDRGRSLRECRRQSGGTAFPLAGDHGTRDRPALFGTVGPAASPAGAETDGSGRDLPGKERQVSDGSEPSGNWRAAVVWERAKEGDAGRVLQDATQQRAAPTNRGGLCGHVGTVPAQHGGVGAGVPHRIRQVPHHPARQRCGRRGAAGRVLPQRAEDARCHQREEVAAAEPLEEPGKEPTRRSESGITTQSASVQSLPAQRKLGTALGLPLRGRYAELSAEVDGSTAMAAIALLSEARGYAGQTPWRDSELLSDQGSLRGRRSYQRQHPYVDQPRPRL